LWAVELFRVSDAASYISVVIFHVKKYHERLLGATQRRGCTKGNPDSFARQTNLEGYIATSTDGGNSWEQGAAEQVGWSD
jgi:hypothetical protein